MRKHSLRLSVLLLTLLLVVVLAVCLAACDPAKDPQTPEEHTTHTPDSTTDWHSDETDHWHLCEEGGEPLSKAAHAFELSVDGEQKTLTCSVCGKSVDASTATMKSNDTEHWYEIEKDGETIKTAPVAHDFALLVEGEQKSLKCSVCEKTLDASAATMNKNAEGHWYEIEKDGKTYKTASTSHSKSAKAVDKGEQHAYSCTVCQYEYAPEDHTLSYNHDVEGGHHAVCADCEYVGSNEACAKAENASYTDLEDGEHHSFVCDKCKETVTESHTLGSNYRTDEDNHWKVCSDCKATVGSEGHTVKEMTTEDQHWTECEVCGERLTQPTGHNKIWKETEDHKQHYEACSGCSKTFSQPEAHTHSGWEDKGENCGFNCTTCKMDVTAEHDYTESASCINCGHDDARWTLKDNEDDTYTLVGYNYNTALSQFRGTEDEPIIVELPKYYKGKPIVALDNNDGKSFYNNATDAMQGYAVLVIPEGYKTIGNFNADSTNNNGARLNIEEIYLPSTVEKIYRNFWRGIPLYISDVAKYCAIECESTAVLQGGIFSDLYVKNGAGEYILTKDLVIPESVTEIKNSAAFGNLNLDSLELPASLQSIKSLQADYRNIGTLKIKTLQQALTLDINNFIGMSLSVKSLVIEDISEQGLTEEFHIPETLTTITSGKLFENEAFDVVTKLYIHKDVTSLGNLEFKNVTEVHFESKNNMLNVMNQTAWRTLNNSSTEARLKVYVGDEEVKNLVITDEMLGEGDSLNAFCYNNSVETIKFETSKKLTLGAWMFAYNAVLKSVDFGSITTDAYPASLFSHCGQLAGVIKLPEGPTKVTSTGWFDNCPLITDIILPESLTDLDVSYDRYQYYPFSDCGANIIFPEDIEVQDNLTWGFFYEWTGTSIVIPKGLKDSMKYICGSDGFGTILSAQNLTRVYFQGTDEEWTAIKAELGKVTKPSTSVLVNATALAYAKADPGKGNNAYTWAYDENGTLKEWYPEPECEGGHNFEYQSDDAQHWGQCSKCQYQLNHSNHVADPEKVGHDGSQCWDVCSICEKEFGKADHTPGTEYKHDAAGHQRLCTRCGEPAETVQSHVADTESYKSNGEQHWRLCKDCGEPIEHTAHTAGEEHGNDETTHWSLCKDCGAKIDSTVAAHDKEGAVIGSGEVAGHHANCSVCGAGDVLVSHTYTVDEEGFADGVCTKCHFSLFTLDTQNHLTNYKGTDIEKLVFPTVVDGKDVLGIAGGAVKGNSPNYTYSQQCIPTNSGVRVIKFPDSDKFTFLGDAAFAGNTMIEEVIFNKYITKIGSNTMTKAGYVFYYCASLNKVTFPEDTQLKEITAYSFGCTAFTEFTIPDTVEKLGSHIFDYCEDLTTVNFPKTSDTLTEIPSGIFTGCSSLTEFTIPAYIKTLAAAGAFSGSFIKKLVIPETIEKLPTTLGAMNNLTYLEINQSSLGNNWVSSLASIETVWFKAPLTAVGTKPIPSGTPETSQWFFSNTVEELKTMFAKVTNATNQGYIKTVNVYAKSDDDPSAKGEDLGDYIDGYWHEEGGQPKRWGNYLMFRTTDYVFNLNSGVDDKTLALTPSEQSGDVTYEAGEGVSVSGEGVVTFTKPGYFTVTAFITGHEEETTVELHFFVYSDENYLVGTLNGTEVSAKQDDYTMEAGSTEYTYRVVIEAKENDKFMVALTGSSEKFGASNLTEAERDFLTKGDDGYLNFSKAGKYRITVTYAQDGITINVQKAAYSLAIRGRENSAARGIIKTQEFDINQGGTVYFEIELTGEDLKQNGAIPGWPGLQFTITMPNGDVIWYASDKHGMNLSGNAFRSAKTAGFWCATNSTANLWYEGTPSETAKWKFAFTIDDQGTITYCKIDSVSA